MFGAFQTPQSATVCVSHHGQICTDSLPAYLPVFPKSSSTELDKTIKTIQDKILVRAHLSPGQRRLINDPSRAGFLAKEEVVIAIGDHDVRLRHVDVQRDRPSPTKTFREALSLTKTETDWNLWHDLFKAYHSAKISFSGTLTAKFVRKALEAQRLDLIIKLLSNADSTGLTLAQGEVRDLVFAAVRARAESSGWDPVVVKASVKQAEKLLLLMETKAHVDKTNGPVAPLLPISVATELSYRLHLAPQVEEVETVEAETKPAFVPEGYLQKAESLARRMVSFSDFEVLVSCIACRLS
jgi:hypothetical protein